MVNNWIFIAKRPGGDLRTIRGVIEGGIWDFVRLRDARFFEPDIEVQRPRDFGIGFGPSMIVLLI